MVLYCAVMRISTDPPMVTDSFYCTPENQLHPPPPTPTPLLSVTNPILLPAFYFWVRSLFDTHLCFLAPAKREIIHCVFSRMMEENSRLEVKNGDTVIVLVVGVMIKKKIILEYFYYDPHYVLPWSSNKELFQSTYSSTHIILHMLMCFRKCDHLELLFSPHQFVMAQAKHVKNWVEERDKGDDLHLCELYFIGGISHRTGRHDSVHHSVCVCNRCF